MPRSAQAPENQFQNSHQAGEKTFGSPGSVCRTSRSRFCVRRSRCWRFVDMLTEKPDVADVASVSRMSLMRSRRSVSPLSQKKGTLPYPAGGATKPAGNSCAVAAVQASR
ncbi:MAG: hypothetical protein ACLR8Y_18215 [Alistipes indistinctus]